jgi:hypothetical protein
MQGVEILNTIHEYAYLVEEYWFIIFFLLALCTCIIGATTTKYVTIQRICVFLVVVFTIGMVVSGIGAAIKTDEIVDTKYQVTISDEVSMTEFYEHYEVIEQDGKIFTVREKTNEE